MPILIMICMPPASAEHAGRLTHIEGTVAILRDGAEKWRGARPGMPVRTGDQLYAREESFAEIIYANGAILRMDENTKIVIESASETTAKTGSRLGSVWVNMRKLVGPGKQFELSSPTATAAIRGTRFQMTTAKDSSTDVSVFEGNVAVGPSSSQKRRKEKEKEPRLREPAEMPGPEEIPGPFEVPLSQWKTIVAGQRISVRADGAFAQKSFDTAEAARSPFVKKNMARDAALEQDAK